MQNGVLQILSIPNGVWDGEPSTPSQAPAWKAKLNEFFSLRSSGFARNMFYEALLHCKTEFCGYFPSQTGFGTENL
ncbi:MAG: hypothetical protein K1X86_10365 [Ignavibacteria bacterium]|nr:hypothetical protein [Ignavibacteria bacterium]